MTRSLPITHTHTHAHTFFPSSNLSFVQSLDLSSKRGKFIFIIIHFSFLLRNDIFDFFSPSSSKRSNHRHLRSSNLAQNMFGRSIEKISRTKHLQILTVSGVYFVTFLNKNGHSGPLFLYFCISFVIGSKKCSISKFADDWIQTGDLFCWKRPLYHLSNNHCPMFR